MEWIAAARAAPCPPRVPGPAQQFDAAGALDAIGEAELIDRDDVEFVARGGSPRPGPATRWCWCAASRPISCPAPAASSTRSPSRPAGTTTTAASSLDNYLRVTWRAKAVVPGIWRLKWTSDFRFPSTPRTMSVSRTARAADNASAPAHRREHPPGVDAEDIRAREPSMTSAGCAEATPSGRPRTVRRETAPYRLGESRQDATTDRAGDHHTHPRGPAGEERVSTGTGHEDRWAGARRICARLLAPLRCSARWPPTRLSLPKFTGTISLRLFAGTPLTAAGEARGERTKRH